MHSVSEKTVESYYLYGYPRLLHSYPKGFGAGQSGAGRGRGGLSLNTAVSPQLSHRAAMTFSCKTEKVWEIVFSVNEELGKTDLIWPGRVGQSTQKCLQFGQACWQWRVIGQFTLCSVVTVTAQSGWCALSFLEEFLVVSRS